MRVRGPRRAENNRFFPRVREVGLKPVAEWATKAGRVFGAKSRELANEGGGEHDVIILPGRTLKMTLPGETGQILAMSTGFRNPEMRPAWPHEYLRNLEVLNKLFGGDIRVEGVARENGQLSLVISQQTIEGSVPSVEKIASFMKKQGFARTGQVLNSAWRSASSLCAKTRMFTSIRIIDHPWSQAGKRRRKVRHREALPCLKTSEAVGTLCGLMLLPARKRPHAARLRPLRLRNMSAAKRLGEPVSTANLQWKWYFSRIKASHGGIMMSKAGQVRYLGVPPICRVRG